MKSWLIFSFVLILQVGFSQDTIVFSSGKIRQVDVLDYTNDGLLNYVYHNDTHHVELTEVIEFSNLGQWYSYVMSTSQVIEISGSNYSLYYSFFREPSKHMYSRFSIGTNLTSPFIYSDEKRNVRSLILADHPIITVVPEVRIFDKLAIKFPICFGVNFQRPTTLFATEEQQSYPLYGADEPYIFGAFNRYNFFNFDQIGKQLIDFDLISTGNYSYSSDSQQSHPHSILFQVGITPKFYPFGQRNQALFVAQSFNVGIADYFSVDYFLDVDTMTTQQITQEDQIWYLKKERAELHSSKFFYFRYEALVGVDLNWGKNWCISLESGFSTGPKNKGEADRVFMRIGDGDYEYYGSNTPQFIPPLYSVSRIHFVFKFSDKKETN